MIENYFSNVTNKISILFFEDKDVRAVWDAENTKWWFNVIDIVALAKEFPNSNSFMLLQFFSQNQTLCF